MRYVAGRDREAGPVAELGSYRALDGSSGASLALDVDGPHAVTVVGKRGYGKSHTLGVLAEELATTAGVAPVVVDPLGVFGPLGTADGVWADRATTVEAPRVSPAALDPQSWCPLLGLSPESGAGGLVWRAARTSRTLDGMTEHVESADAREADVRAAANHLAMAAAWDVFDHDGLAAPDLTGGEVTVLDCAGLGPGSMNAVGRVVAETLYRACVTDRSDRLPWLLVDEAHAFFDGIAADALETLSTRGRAPGVSFVAATQRPSAVPEVCLSQSDVLVAHRLTSEADLAALEAARPTYLDGTFEARMPTAVGDVVVVDDATETVHAAHVRERYTPHGGDSPSAREVAGEIA